MAEMLILLIWENENKFLKRKSSFIFLKFSILHVLCAK